jgi:two-component system LytT family response regulator
VSAAFPLGTVVVDDEELARALLRELLSPHADVKILAECANGFEAVKAINELRPDLVFLDIQMPKLDGFEVLELVEGSPAVVFVTAYDQYALRAFDANAVDYLLKPFDGKRFDAALEKARKRLGAAGEREAAREIAGRLSSAAPSDRMLSRIAVRNGAKVTVIPVPALDFAQAQDDYVLLKTAGESHIKQQTLASLESRLDPGRFVRIHRSFLVNIDRLARLVPGPTGGHVAVLADGTRLPVSRTGADRLRRLLGEGPAD